MHTAALQNANLLTHRHAAVKVLLPSVFERDVSRGKCKESVVFSDTHIPSCKKPRAALSDDDTPGLGGLARAEERGLGEESARASAFPFDEMRAGYKIFEK